MQNVNLFLSPFILKMNFHVSFYSGIPQVPGSTPTSATPLHPQGNPSTRRILEKPVAVVTPPPAPVMKEAQASVSSSLLLSPVPQPHAGCYAVPVPFTTAAPPASARPVITPQVVSSSSLTRESSVTSSTPTTKVSVIKQLIEINTRYECSTVFLSSVNLWVAFAFSSNYRGAARGFLNFTLLNYLFHQSISQIIGSVLAFLILIL